jgi:predicted MPP superfamily phosphohydrolase
MPRALFFLLAIFIWVMAHFYVGRRLITESRVPRPAAIVGWSVLLSDVVLAIFAIANRRIGLEVPFANELQWITYLGMGAFVLFFVLVLARDAVSLILWAIEKFSKDKDEDRAPENPEHGGKLTRRELFQRASSVGIVAAGTAGVTHGLHEARRVPRVKKVEVPIKGLDPALDGFHIVQLSDIHVGPTIKGDFLSAVVDEVNKLGADMVAITGDLIDGHVISLREDVSHLGRLKSRHGTFYVTGNHEYYWDAPGWAQEVARLGGKPLLNAHQVIQHEGAPLVVAGVNDYSAGRHIPEHASSPKKAVAGAPKDAFKLLLAHQPKSIYEAAEANIDLQLSGHTHGGQFWPWNLVVGLAHPFSAGLDMYEEKTWIYVSCGTGYWGPPMRIGAPSEITSIKLVRA